jgi:hypothetical protein
LVLVLVLVLAQVLALVLVQEIHIDRIHQECFRQGIHLATWTSR